MKIGVWAIGAVLCLSQAFGGSITLVGVGSIPGNATDLSGTTGVVAGEKGTVPHNQLGTFGSGIAYTGSGNIFIATNDRGYSDGLTKPDYLDRFQVLEIALDARAKTLAPKLLETHFYKTETGQNFVGQSSAFDTAHPSKSLRLDAEGIRVASDGNIFISDEYGPYIYEFNRQGIRIRTIPVPAKFSIAHPSASGEIELSENSSGRQSNRGMEGLAISADGQTLIGIMQGPLLQDGALDGNLKRIGVNLRLLKVSLKTRASAEFVYPLENGVENGVNEILAINDHEFLVIERDGSSGVAAKFKKIFRIDINGATDVSKLAALPRIGSAGFKPVSKTLFIDLLDPAYGLAGAAFPEKIEGLAFGPDLPDGRHVLYVTSDNDLSSTKPTWFYAFAITADALPKFQRQVIHN
jgi:hypothetical protein